jgi:hypothetical protein
MKRRHRPENHLPIRGSDKGPATALQDNKNINKNSMFKLSLRK